MRGAKESELKKMKPNSRNIISPSYRQNGVLNIAINKDNIEKIRL